VRGTRWLLIAAVLLAGSVAVTYHFQKREQERAAPPPPEPLPVNVNAEQEDFTYSHTEGDNIVWEVRARRMQRLSVPSNVQLEGVELRVYDSDSASYDRIRSDSATFDQESGVFHSEEDVEIIAGVSSDGSVQAYATQVRTSDLRYNANTGRAETDSPASFVFAGGEGSSVGAVYDSVSGDLRMLSNVELHRDAGIPIDVTAGELLYREDSAVIYLSPWSKMERGSLVLDADSSEVVLNDGVIRVVHAANARGKSLHGDRLIEYSAQLLDIEFTDGGAIERVQGNGGASVVASSEDSVTTVSGNDLTMEFTPAGEESLLRSAVAVGSGVLESRPMAGEDSPPPTRVLRSENLSMRMLPDGRQIDQIETGMPGTVEFLPNRAGEPHRRLDGDRLWIRYAPENRIESFRAIGVATRTQRPAEAGKEPQSPLLTWSNDLEATFDPETEELIRLEQWVDFRFEEGGRGGRAERAVLDAALETITLVGQARLADESGSTSADQIVLYQREGNLRATGSVNSTRLPEGDATGGGLLGAGESLHATADSMATTDGARNLTYEGSVVMWQGWNRLEAGRVEIDRDARTLEAEGGVVTRVGEAPRPGDSTDQGPGVIYTRVRASELSYRDSDRLAWFRDNVELDRPGTEVTSQQLRAWFTTAGGDEETPETRLDRAFADGGVEIVVARDQGSRQGSADHAEYYLSDEKLILNGGRPRLVDSARGATEGNELTYFVSDDRLLVDGSEAEPTVSEVRQRTR